MRARPGGQLCRNEHRSGYHRRYGGGCSAAAVRMAGGAKWRVISCCEAVAVARVLSAAVAMRDEAWPGSTT